MDGRWVTAIIAGLAAACLFMALWTGGALAQGARCAPHDMIVGELASRFKESGAVKATSGDGQLLVEVLVSAGRTWTMIATGGNGIACIIAAGEDWESDAAPPHKPGAAI